MKNWQVDPIARGGCYAIVTPDGREVATATQRDAHPILGQGITDADALEHAHLIAAAPDLLDSMQKYIAALDGWENTNKAERRVKIAEAMMREAIAKATDTA